MIAGIAILLACQLAGEAVVRTLGLPLPGPVLGMALLVAVLAVRARVAPTDDAAPDRPIGRAADALLAALSLLFVPAGVGVVQHLGLIGDNGVAIVVTLIGSTVVTLVATVLAFVGVKRLLRLEEPGP